MDLMGTYKAENKVAKPLPVLKRRIRHITEAQTLEEFIDKTWEVPSFRTPSPKMNGKISYCNK